MNTNSTNIVAKNADRLDFLLSRLDKSERLLLGISKNGKLKIAIQRVKPMVLNQIGEAAKGGMVINDL